MKEVGLTVRSARFPFITKIAIIKPEFCVISEAEVAALLLHEHGFVGHELAGLGLFFCDGLGPVAVAIDNASC